MCQDHVTPLLYNDVMVYCEGIAPPLSIVTAADSQNLLLLVDWITIVTMVMIMMQYI